MRRLIAATLVILLAALPLRDGMAGEAITWYHPDYPPTFILEGPFKGQGIVDSFVKGVQERLTDFEHGSGVANMKRIIRSMESGARVCAASLFRTPERESAVVFSEPYMFIFPVGLVFREEDRASFEALADDAGNVSLEALLRKGDMVLGFSTGRSYHKEVNRLIAELATPRNSREVNKSTISEGIIDLLLHHRVDYAIDFSQAVTWMAEGAGVVGKLGFLPIKEARSIQFNHMGCSNTEWGRRVIAEIDSALAEMRTDPAYYGAYLRWISAVERRRYEEFLAKGFPDQSKR